MSLSVIGVEKDPSRFGVETEVSSRDATTMALRYSSSDTRRVEIRRPDLVYTGLPEQETPSRIVGVHGRLAFEEPLSQRVK